MTEIKVNLGCGSNIIPGWVNIDFYYEPKEPNPDFVKADILGDLPLESGSVGYLLCDQVLEHIPMSDVPLVLYNIRRVLKVGGKAVIVVPDFKGAVEQWLSIDHNQHFNPLVYQYLSEVIYGNQQHGGEFHKTAMSPGFLHYVLGMVGLHEHDLTIYPALGPLPNFPGIIYNENAKCRNAQLVAEITKK